MEMNNRWKNIQALLFLTILLLFPDKGFVQDSREADSLINQIELTSDPVEKFRLFLTLATLNEQADPAEALEWISRAEEIAAAESIEEIDHFNLLIEKAEIYFFLSELEKAMDYAVQARELAERNNFEMELAIAMDAIGIIYYEIGDESKSSEYFFSSLRIYEKLKDKEGMAQTFCRVGTLYFNQKENEKAIEYYQRSIDIARELKNTEGISSNLHNIATVYTSENKINQALPLYFEALNLNREAGNILLQGSNHLNISNLYLKQGRLDSASVHVRKAIEIFQKIGNQVRYVKSRLTEGEIFLELKMPDEAIGVSVEALDLSLQHGFKESVYEAAALLHKIYLAKKDTAMAYHYAILEHNWKDSLALGENKRVLAHQEMQYQFDKKEQQIRIEKQRKNFLLILLGTITLFSIIVLILLWSRYKLKEKKALLEKKSLEMDLDYKKKELTANVLSLMKKNEMLSEITKKIVKIKNESEQDETRAALKKVIAELQKSTDEEILKEFSLRFREVHKDFYDSLMSRFPGLTPSELKLCAFLRLNMTTKEIAELTGQQVSTLENARYRLRQKLGITSSDVNLVTFLSQL